MVMFTNSHHITCDISRTNILFELGSERVKVLSIRLFYQILRGASYMTFIGPWQQFVQCFTFCLFLAHRWSLRVSTRSRGTKRQTRSIPTSSVLNWKVPERHCTSPTLKKTFSSPFQESRESILLWVMIRTFWSRTRCGITEWTSWSPALCWTSR